MAKRVIEMAVEDRESNKKVTLKASIHTRPHMLAPREIDGAVSKLTRLLADALENFDSRFGIENIRVKK